ncbi:MAG TPA: UvrD-helicase domain-containing protein, partial [Flavobacteriales bacterium]|nr:UvrD-helicase domain-containing protein [Flavobacteriales bacterium]
AFETASPFETELVADQADMVASIADDFYRMRIAAGAVPEFISFARSRRVSPEWFMELAGQRNLSAAVIPEGGGSKREGDLERLTAEYRQAFARLKEAWPDARAEVERLLCDKDVINQTTHKITRMPGYLEAVDQFLALGPAMLPDAGCLARFTPEAVTKATKKGGKTPEHPVFDLCRAVVEAAAELMAAMEGLITGLKVDFLGYLDRALPRRKDRQGVVHFDDLLLRMHRALGSRGGEALAEAVRARFAAALIDEFQDTDSLQYEIFRKCFANSTLFFIGDPKQAVYSFRGADVFTYAKAAAAVEPANTHTLLHNWRSTPGLIEAVNTVFSGVSDPFVFDWIRFEAAEPAPKEDRKDLAGLDGGPLMIWFLESADGSRLTVEQAKSVVCKAVAREISRLLNLSRTGVMTLGSDALKPRDMAVLVRTNTQARMVRDA